MQRRLSDVHEHAGSSQSHDTVDMQRMLHQQERSFYKKFKRIDASGKDAKRSHEMRLRVEHGTLNSTEENLIERTKKASDHVANLSNEIYTSSQQLKRVQRELTVIDRLEQESLNSFPAYVDRLLQGSSDIQSKSYKKHENEYNRIRSEATKIREYAQKKLDEAPKRRERLQQEQTRIETRLAELQDQHRQAWDAYQDLSKQLNSRLPEFADDVTETRIKDVQTRVQTQKEQLYHVIKEHEAILDEPDHYSQQKNDLKVLRDNARKLAANDSIFKKKILGQKSEAEQTIAQTTTQLRELYHQRLDLQQRSTNAEIKVKRLSAELQKAEQELTSLKQKASESSELPLTTSLEKSSHAEITTRLWDVTRIHYEARQYLDTMTRHFNESGKMEKFYQDQIISPPDISKHDSDYTKWNNFSVYQEKLHTKRNDLQSMQNSYATATHGIAHQERQCQQAIHELHEARNAMSGTHENVSLQATMEEIGKVQDALQRTHTSLHKQYVFAYEKYEQTKIQRETFERGDLAEVDARVEALRSKLGDDHPYFSWYERNEYDTGDRQSMATTLRGGCVVAAAWTRISDYPKSSQFDMDKITQKQIAEAVKLAPTGGALMRDIPKAFRKLGVPEPYAMADLRGDHSLASLKTLLKHGPAIVSLYSRDQGGHALVVDKIETDRETGLTYVCIRDQLGGLGNKGSSYKIRAHAFQSVWNRSEVVVPTKSLSWLQKFDNRLDQLAGKIF